MGSAAAVPFPYGEELGQENAGQCLNCIFLGLGPVWELGVAANAAVLFPYGEELAQGNAGQFSNCIFLGLDLYMDH